MVERERNVVDRKAEEIGGHVGGKKRAETDGTVVGDGGNGAAAAHRRDTGSYQVIQARRQRRQSSTTCRRRRTRRRRELSFHRCYGHEYECQCQDFSHFINLN